MIRALVIVAALSTTAHADLFDDGQALYSTGKYAEAIAKFEQGYKLAADPVYLFNIAQSYRKMFDCVAAADYYTRYLAADQDADPRQRERVTQWIAELAPCVDQRRAEIEKAKRSVVTPPIVTPPPATSVVATPVTTEIDRGGPLRLTGLALGGAGLVALAAGGYFAARSAAIRDELAAACADGCDWDVEQAKDADGTRANRIATWALVGGGLATLAGGALYVVGRMRVERVEVLPSPTGGGATVSAWLSF